MAPVDGAAGGVTVETLRGSSAARWLPALASLRIEVFREFPYLYEGSLQYEETYLAGYARCPDAAIVIARDGERVIGAATALPLVAHGEAVAPPLVAAGHDPARVFYFGESVLLPAYRGRGLGHRFFDEREAAARDGWTVAAFCAVERPVDHPRRPAAYIAHDAFWTRRGYTRRPDIHTTFSWRDLDDPPGTESEKTMVFWVKELA